MATPTPPSGVQLCAQGDVEISVGGAANLVELLDKNGDGIADADLVTGVISRASTDVLQAFAIGYQIATLMAPFPDAIIYLAAKIAGYYAWCLASSGVEIPDGQRAIFAQCQKDLEDIAQGKRSLGVASPPGFQMNVQQVLPNSPTVSRANMKGFW